MTAPVVQHGDGPLPQRVVDAEREAAIDAASFTFDQSINGAFGDLFYDLDDIRLKHGLRCGDIVAMLRDRVDDLADLYRQWDIEAATP